MNATELNAYLKANYKPGGTIVLTGDIIADGTGTMIRPSPSLLSNITLDCRKANIRHLFYPSAGVVGLTLIGGQHFGLRFDKTENLTVKDAKFDGPVEPNGYGLTVNVGKNVTLTNLDLENYKSGITFSQVEGFTIRGVAVSRMRSDGMTIGLSRKGLIERCVGHGTRITAAEHPDFIQLFSRATHLPTADITIRECEAVGMTQGIGCFNHTVAAGNAARPEYKVGVKVFDGWDDAGQAKWRTIQANGEMVNDGGFDRLVAEGNRFWTGYPHAIAFSEARDSWVRNNRIRTYPCSQWRASINVSSDTQRSGNLVEAWLNSPEIRD